MFHVQPCPRLRGVGTDGVVEWSVVEATEIDVPTLYGLLVLRSAVFVVEQECAYQDPDGRDLVPGTRHVLGRRGDELVAYARVLPATGEKPPRIGRVIVSEAARGQRLARQLMDLALQTCEESWPGSGVELGAQAHLTDFYGSLGFVPVGAPYDEDGIPHQWMRREPNG